MPLTLEDLQKDMHAEFASLRQDIKTNFAVLNSRIDDLRTDFHAQFGMLRKDINDFYKTLGQHDNRIEQLETGE